MTPGTVQIRQKLIARSMEHDWTAQYEQVLCRDYHTLLFCTWPPDDV